MTGPLYLHVHNSLDVSHVVSDEEVLFNGDDPRRADSCGVPTDTLSSKGNKSVLVSLKGNLSGASPVKKKISCHK